MSSVKLAFGRRDGRIWHVSEVERGRACGCNCPECGAELDAKKGPINAHHFAHAAKSVCANGPESALHKYAKQLIAESSSFRAPPLTVTLRHERYGFERSETIEGADLAVRESWLERKHGDVIPDVELETDQGPVFAEVAVTNFTGENKRETLRELGVAAVEISLDGVSWEMPLSHIKHAILHAAARRTWLYHPQGAAITQRLADQLVDDAMEFEAANDIEGLELIAAASRVNEHLVAHQMRVIPKEQRTRRYAKLPAAEKLAYNAKLLTCTPATLPEWCNRPVADGNPFLALPVVWRTGILLKFIVRQRQPTTAQKIVIWCEERYGLGTPMHLGFALEPVAHAEAVVDDFLRSLEGTGVRFSGGGGANFRQYTPLGRELYELQLAG